MLIEELNSHFAKPVLCCRFFLYFFCGGYFFRLIFNELRYFNKIL